MADRLGEKTETAHRALGIDVGSTTVKVVLTEGDHLLYSRYERHLSQVRQKTLEMLAEAAELLRAGRSFEEVGDRILARRPHMCQFFTVDDLNYLKRGGRISGAAALVGSVLGIKPILRGDETGHIVSCGKVRGNKKAYAELADYFNKRALDKTARIGIAHADNREGTDYLLGLLRERGFTGECLEVYYEPVTGAHVGPGTVALFFYGTEK